ncbi:unnamed protein product [Caenorhabditis auriculariae]|uniref:Uncharacterized protein n=1 Tax=Caenorhabditis auriculariae TaxID=2777116 RepID=A0A8S1HG93_9PELO|nr:unnamed protein product [Caenorhabditis auriculariae]
MPPRCNERRRNGSRILTAFQDKFRHHHVFDVTFAGAAYLQTVGLQRTNKQQSCTRGCNSWSAVQNTVGKSRVVDADSKRGGAPWRLQFRNKEKRRTDRRSSVWTEVYKLRPTMGGPESFQLTNPNLNMIHMPEYLTSEMDLRSHCQPRRFSRLSAPVHRKV